MPTVKAPTLSDLLGYYEDEDVYTYQDSPISEEVLLGLQETPFYEEHGYTPYQSEISLEGGKANMADYLIDILLRSKGDWWEELEGRLGAGHAQFSMENKEKLPGFLKEVVASHPNFMDLSRDDIYNLVKGQYGYGLGQERHFEEGYVGQSWKGERDVLDDFTSYIQQLQEGFKAAQSPEAFGYGQKLSDVQTTGRRDIKSTREGYIPGEILSRFATLQGKSGAEQIGESKESEYLSDVYGIQRGTGRDVRGIQKEYEEDWYSGIENWLSSVSS